MANQNPYLNDPRVHAVLGQWYDIVNANQGLSQGPYGGARGYGRPMPGYGGMMVIGQDPTTGAPIVVPAPNGAQAPMLPPPPPMMAPAPPMTQQMCPPMAYPFPPQAMVVEAAKPTFAARDILPMSTGVPILPTQSAQITGRPQCLVFQCNRFLISNAGTAGGSADWIVNDIKIGNRSQFVQSGDVPGDLFATNAIDTFVRFEAAQTAMDVVVVVTYIGLNESGAPFFGAMVGTAAI